MVDEELLTVKQVAERLKVHEETVRIWLRKWRLHGRRMSDRMGWRIPASELRRFIDEELLPADREPEP
jgi:excisionase family DNA binding protein